MSNNVGESNLIQVVLASLGVVLTFLSLFGIPALRRLVRDLIKDEINKAEIRISAFLDYSKAYDLWETNTELAITLGEMAVRTKALIKRDHLQAMSNLAYCYAMEPSPHDKERAKETLNQRFLYPDRAVNFKINYGFVMMQYTPAHDKEELNNIKTFFKDILLRRDIGQDDKEEIEEYLQSLNNKLNSVQSPFSRQG